MPLMAVAFPIVPGKTGEWREFAATVNGSRREDFVASRERVGLRERTFFQSTPMGDLVIVTVEGDDPLASFGQLLSGTDEFSQWFLGHAADLHGFDLSQLPAGAPSELVIDSASSAVTA